MPGKISSKTAPPKRHNVRMFKRWRTKLQHVLNPVPQESKDSPTSKQYQMPLQIDQPAACPSPNSRKGPEILPTMRTRSILHLPPNIREIIYEYALSEPRGLFYRYKKYDKTFKLYSSIDADPALDLEANQLKYVCRQLHKETSGLGMKYNHLNFVRANFSEPGSISQCFDFLIHCTRQTLQQVRRIALHGALYDISTLSDVQGLRDLERMEITRLLSFCWRYPQVAVDLYPQRASVQYEHSQAYFTLAMFKGKKPITCFQERLGQELSKEIRRYGEMACKIDPPNLTVWPRAKPQFDEEPFRRWLFADMKARKAHIPSVTDFDKIVENGRVWYTSGF